MNIFINKLPDDVINCIIPYTYELQTPNLLRDIENYKKTKDKITKLYYNYWIIFIEDTEPEDKYWLINDIIAYANNYKATMYGYIDVFYSIFQRNLKLQSYEDVNNFLDILETKNVDTQINIIWGLLTPKERNDIIDIFLE